MRLSANSANARRDFPQARALGHELLSRGDVEGDAVLVTEGHYLIGVTSFWLGDLATSRHHLAAALASNRPEHTPAHLHQFGQDPRAVCLVRLAFTEFHLGRPVEAAELFEEGLAAAANTAHTYTDVYVRAFGAWYLAEAGDAARGPASSTRFRRPGPPTSSPPSPVSCPPAGCRRCRAITPPPSSCSSRPGSKR